MTSAPRASNSIFAAAIFAILGGAAAALFNFAALLLFSPPRVPVGAPSPASIGPLPGAVWLSFLVLALFVVFVAIQLIRLRNWARIAMLVIAGCLLFFGLVGVGVIFMTLFGAALPGAVVSKSLLASVLAITYGIPIAISLWWLILFTRRSIIAQFHSSTSLRTPSPTASTLRFSEPGCPLPVRIIGWYLASFVLFLPFLPFFPGHVPAFFLGHVFHGPAAMAIFIINFALLFIPGFGLLLLKRWSYPLTIASQLLICFNAISTTLSPAYEETVRAMLNKMNLPGFPPGSEQMLNYSRYFNLLSLIIPIAILITLFVTQRKFYGAADRISKSPIDPQRNSTV